MDTQTTPPATDSLLEKIKSNLSRIDLDDLRAFFESEGYSSRLSSFDSSPEDDSTVYSCCRAILTSSITPDPTPVEIRIYSVTSREEANRYVTACEIVRCHEETGTTYTLFPWVYFSIDLFQKAGLFIQIVSIPKPENTPWLPCAMSSRDCLEAMTGVLTGLEILHKNGVHFLIPTSRSIYRAKAGLPVYFGEVSSALEPFNTADKSLCCIQQDVYQLLCVFFEARTNVQFDTFAGMHLVDQLSQPEGLPHPYRLLQATPKETWRSWMQWASAGECSEQELLFISQLVSAEINDTFASQLVPYTRSLVSPNTAHSTCSLFHYQSAPMHSTLKQGSGSFKDERNTAHLSLKSSAFKKSTTPVISREYVFQCKQHHPLRPTGMDTVHLLHRVDSIKCQQCGYNIPAKSGSEQSTESSVLYCNRCHQGFCIPCALQYLSLERLPKSHKCPNNHERYLMAGGSSEQYFLCKPCNKKYPLNSLHYKCDSCPQDEKRLCPGCVSEDPILQNVYQTEKTSSPHSTSSSVAATHIIPKLPEARVLKKSDVLTCPVCIGDEPLELKTADGMSYLYQQRTDKPDVTWVSGCDQCTQNCDVPPKYCRSCQENHKPYFKITSGYLFHCEICNYDMCATCTLKALDYPALPLSATCNGGRQHEMGLEINLMDLQEDYKCSQQGCQNKLSSKGKVHYSCQQCLEKKCLKCGLKKALESFLPCCCENRQHQMRLVISSPQSNVTCSSCQKRCKPNEFRFQCKECAISGVIQNFCVNCGKSIHINWLKATTKLVPNHHQ